MKSSMRTWESGHARGCSGARRRADELGQASGKGPSPGRLAEIDDRDEAAGRPVSVLNPRRPRAPPLLPRKYLLTFDR